VGTGEVSLLTFCARFTNLQSSKKVHLQGRDTTVSRILFVLYSAGALNCKKEEANKSLPQCWAEKQRASNKITQYRTTADDLFRGTKAINTESALANPSGVIPKERPVPAGPSQQGCPWRGSGRWVWSQWRKVARGRLFRLDSVTISNSSVSAQCPHWLSWILGCWFD